MARVRGIAVSATFGRTPGWANGGKGPLYLPDSNAQFARSLGFLAHRYRGRITSWEIWNEPNHASFLAGASVADYTKALCAAHQAVHRAAPGDVVVAGGTAGNDHEWYRGIYRNGGKNCFDVAATHPYNSDRSPYFRPPTSAPWWFQNVRYVRRVMRHFGDIQKPIWFTEVGWSTHPNTARTGYGKGVSLQTQARYLTDLFQITHRRYPYVRRVSWYMDEDMTSSTLHKDHYGLFRTNGTAKPAYWALRAYATRLNR